MKIAHFSMPADNPALAAQALAAIMQGEVIPFPPAGHNSYMAWSKDGEIEIEVTPRELDIVPGEVEAIWTLAGETRRASNVHVAIAVDRPANEILSIAQEMGWPARICSRGEGIFHVAEVWVDGIFLIEFLDPEFSAEYHRSVTPANWKRYLAEGAAA